MLILANPNIKDIAEKIGDTYTSATRNRAGVTQNAEGVLLALPLFDMPEGMPYVARDGKLVPYVEAKEGDMAAALSGEPVSFLVAAVICSRAVSGEINAALSKRLVAVEGQEAPTEVPASWRAAVVRRLARAFKPDEPVSETSVKSKVEGVLMVVRDDVPWEMLLELEAVQTENAALKTEVEEMRRQREAAVAAEAIARRALKSRAARAEGESDSLNGDEEHLENRESGAEEKHDADHGSSETHPTTTPETEAANQSTPETTESEGAGHANTEA